MTNFATDPGAALVPMSPTELALGLQCGTISLGQLNWLFKQLFSETDTYVTGMAGYNATTNELTLSMSDGTTIVVPMAALVADAVAEAVSSSALNVAPDIVNLQTQINTKVDDQLSAAKFDAKVITNPTAFTLGGNTVTCAGAGFVAADVGKIIYCTRGGVGYTGAILPVGTITSVISATQIIVSTVWAEGYSVGIGYELVYGTDDTEALVAAGTALVASNHRSMVLPTGRTILRRAFIDLASNPGSPIQMRAAVKNATWFHVSPDYDFASTAGDRYSNLIYKSPQAGGLGSAVFEGFNISGGLAEYPAAARTVNGFTCPFPGSILSTIIVENLHGFAGGLSFNARVHLESVTSRSHGVTGSAFPTKGLQSVAPITGVNVVTSNCTGSGTELVNIANDAGNNESSVGFRDSHFDECNGGAVVLINVQNALFDNCVGFGGPNSEPGGGNADAWALRLRTNSTAVVNNGSFTGYGPSTSRKSTLVEVGSKLWVMGNAELNAAGDGTGVTLDNQGTVYVGPAVEIIGTIAGTAPILLGGGATPPWTIAQTTGLQTALDSKVDDTQISAFGLTLVNDADAAASRATLGLDSVNNTADAAKPISTATQTALDAKLNKRTAVVGRYYYAYAGEVEIGASINPNQAMFSAFVAQHNMTVGELGIRITTLAAAGNLKLAIYAHNPTTGRPTGNPLGYTGNISTASAVAVSAVVNANFPLVAGTVYWAAVLVDNATVGFQRPSARGNPAASLAGAAVLANVAGIVGANNDKGCYLYTNAFVFAAWGDSTSVTWVDTNNAGNNGPALIVKAV